MESGESPGESVTVKPLKEDQSDTWEKDDASAGTGSTVKQTPRGVCCWRTRLSGALFFFWRKYMVHFVGAGPGAPDLITVRGQTLLTKADVIIYAGSLVNPGLLEKAKPLMDIYRSDRKQDYRAVMEHYWKDGDRTTVSSALPP